MANHYDQEVLKKIQLLQKSDLKQAAQLLQNELKLPYIPQKYQQQLTTLELAINAQIKLQTKPNLKLSVAEVFATCRTPQAPHLQMALQQLRDLHLQKFHPQVAQIFASQQSKIVKATLFEILCEQAVDQQFSVDNVQFNPSKRKSITIQTWFKDAFVKIAQNGLQNASLQTVALQLLSQYALQIFPHQNKFDQVGNTVVALARQMLGLPQNGQSDPQVKLLQKIISNASFEKN